MRSSGESRAGRPEAEPEAGSPESEAEPEAGSREPPEAGSRKPEARYRAAGRSIPSPTFAYPGSSIGNRPAIGISPANAFTAATSARS